MRIAILGATSQIAKDLISFLSLKTAYQLVLFARNVENVTSWLVGKNLPTFEVLTYTDLRLVGKFDAIVNFVGVGNPVVANQIGASIFEVTRKFDQLALDYLLINPKCRYIFMSSGAAYGSNFEKPVSEHDNASVPINKITPQNWYGISKLYAESVHRSMQDLPIVDLRIFNYFSHTQDMDARFLITDIIRAIRDKKIFETSEEIIFRDFIHPSDLFTLIHNILNLDPKNCVVDCYSQAPIDKLGLLDELKKEFNFDFRLVKNKSGLNVTGSKPYYFSLNRNAEIFNFKPAYSSLSGVIRESHSFFENLGDNIVKH